MVAVKERQQVKVRLSPPRHRQAEELPPAPPPLPPRGGGDSDGGNGWWFWLVLALAVILLLFLLYNSAPGFALLATALIGLIGLARILITRGYAPPSTDEASPTDTDTFSDEPAKSPTGPYVLPSDRLADTGLDVFKFTHAYADNQLATNFSSLGPGSAMVREGIGDDLYAQAILATNFWRVWLTTHESKAFLRDSLPARMIVVPRSHLNRFDLLVLYPDLPDTFTPVRSRIDTEMDLVNAIEHAPLTEEKLSRHIGANALRLAREATNGGKQPFAIVTAKEPLSERLYVPSTPLEIVDTSTGDRSTAGVVVEDLTKQGRIGVTAALHAISSSSTNVTVNGASGTVVRSHQITDSAFVEVPKPAGLAISSKGVMLGLAPRGSQAANFVGAVSKNRTTTILGWDPEVPDPSSHRQACIYTGRDAQPGDSGCALVTDDGWIVGFAFERTRPGQSLAQCSWVWANSVMKGLQVRLI